MNNTSPHAAKRSRWQGHKTSAAPFKLALCYYAPESQLGFLSMPLASIAAYVRQSLPDTQIRLFRVLAKDIDGGLSEASEFANQISDWQPNLIAVSLMTPHWPRMKNHLVAVKQKMPNTPVLIGGYQAIVDSHETIAFDPVDFICTGDGEMPTVDLIRYLCGIRTTPVEGLWEKFDDGSIQKTPSIQINDLSSLPFPDYSLYEELCHLREVDTTMIDGDNEFVLPVMTGRGCPYRCTYCSNTHLLEAWRNKSKFLRKYPLEAMIDELIRLKETYNVDYFEFWDELFMSRMDYVKEFFTLYRQKVGVPFSIQGRVEKMSPDFCKLAADAHCRTIFFGIESGDYTYRKNVLNRKMSNQQIIEAARNCADAGINRLTFNIVGMPFETKAQMLETLRLNETIRPEFFYFFTYIPLKGTRLYDLAKDHNLLLDDAQTKVHYLDEYDSGFRMNIKEHPQGMTNQEFRAVCAQMQAFQETNNSLSH